MKSLLTLAAVSVAVVVLLTVPVVYGQDRPAPAPQDRPAAAQEKVFDGQLTKVDTTAKSISVKGADKEMIFAYTDQTQVVGPEKSVQGLAGKTGTQLKVSYREAGGANLATKIEMVQK